MRRLNTPGFLAGAAPWRNGGSSIHSADLGGLRREPPAAALCVGSLVPVFRRQPRAWGVFSLLIVASGVLQPGGWGRYVLPAFPVFLAWALGLENRLTFPGVVVLSTLLLALLTILYTHWYWVA